MACFPFNNDDDDCDDYDDSTYFKLENSDANNNLSS